MSIEAQTLFFGLALACFIAAAAGFGVRKINLMAAGLAFWVFVYFYDALKSM